MPIPILDDILSKFFNTPTDKTRTVVLYGGEPTLNRAGVIHAVDYIRNKASDADCEIVIFTNGILIDDELIYFFQANRVSVIISIDGPKKIHDMFRQCGTDGTFDKVNAVIGKFQRKGIRFGISATIASQNVDKLNELVTYFCERYNPFSIGLNPLHYPPKGRENIAVDYIKMAEKMIEAYVVAADCGIYIEQIMRRVRPFALSQPRLKDCPSCGGMLRVLPDGRFGPCGHFMEEQKEISAAENSFENSRLLKNWNKRLSVTMPECSKCRALALCGGGCPYNSYKNGGDIFTPNDERSCLQADMFLMWMIGSLLRTLPHKQFREVTSDEKRSILGNIDLDKYVPLGGYSQYGEFKLDDALK